MPTRRCSSGGSHHFQIRPNGKAITTSARKPPEKPSDKADRHQIALAKKEGAAYHSLKYMAEDVADSGGMKRAGDYIVAYAQERAEGMYMLREQANLNRTRRQTKTVTWRFPSAIRRPAFHPLSRNHGNTNP